MLASILRALRGAARVREGAAGVAMASFRGGTTFPITALIGHVDYSPAARDSGGRARNIQESPRCKIVLFVAQSDQRVDARGAARGDIARGERHDRQ